MSDIEENPGVEPPGRGWEGSKGLEPKDSAVAEKDSSTSLGRMLQVLDLITFQRPAVTPEEISSEFGYTLSTSYRYVRELTAVGLLASIGAGRYGLGARVIELDLLARLTDPIVVSGRRFVTNLLDCIPIGVVMICELRGTRVVSVMAEKKPVSLDLHHQRGHSMGLFRGAAAKAILAHLPNRRLVRLYQEFNDEIANAGLGEDWQTFRKYISDLRKRPYILTKGELDSRNFALAAPLFYGGGQIAGSLNVILPLTSFDESLVKQLATPLMEAAHSMNSVSQMTAFQPASTPTIE